MTLVVNWTFGRAVTNSDCIMPALLLPLLSADIEESPGRSHQKLNLTAWTPRPAIAQAADFTTATLLQQARTNSFIYRSNSHGSVLLQAL
jgi:hypothetical protein